MKTYKCKSKIISGVPCTENCQILSAFEPRACLRTAVYEEWEIVEEPFKTDVTYALGENDYNLFMLWAFKGKLDTMVNPVMTTPITWQCRASNPKNHSRTNNAPSITIIPTTEKKKFVIAGIGAIDLCDSCKTENTTGASGFLKDDYIPLNLCNDCLTTKFEEVK